MGMTPDVIAQYAYNAGFRGPALVDAVAIAMAESGGRPDAMGDVGLQDQTWGPSVGLWQIRSVNKQKGTGGVRDVSRNTSPTNNAAAAYNISGGGKSFGAWSTYTNGAYKQFLGTANNVVAHVTGYANPNYNGEPDSSTAATMKSMPKIDTGDPGTFFNILNNMLSSPGQPPSPSTETGDSTDTFFSTLKNMVGGQ